jgi:hypothetical protein
VQVERQTADWFGVARYQLSGLIKDWESLDQLRDFWLIRTNSAAWSSDVLFLVMNFTNPGRFAFIGLRASLF